ncbi:MAG: hypothetical protein U0521_21580 [Anaerolineae bacterium]
MSRIFLIMMLITAAVLAGSCNMAAQSTAAQPVDQISTPRRGHHL